ncbi:C6 transcription factor (Ctf1B) [Purpureocillium lavendulum]|uniref:C6 transcription factor (Ctf1B) n=1 Tax=Purpureocillium lavendulum TaxID=1247861 RepID=A0AB34FZV4_9HYPO|nr:C6 transcription factor (Ctf1B) [Purpureocillium lavendulum]
MASLELGEADSGLQVARDAPVAAAADEDLIDYDSDDASPAVHDAKKPSHSGTVATDVEHEGLGSPVANGVGSEPATAANGVDVPEEVENDAMMDQEGFEEKGQHGDGEYPAGRDGTSGEEDRVDLHEIDYDHDDVDYDAPDRGSDHSAAASPSGSHRSHAEDIQGTSAAELPDQADHFEIDWEEEGANEGEDASGKSAAQAAAEHQVAEPTQSADVEHDDPSVAGESGGDDDEDDTSGHESLTQTAPKSGEFPEIHVWYRGEEYPFFSQSSDGFFGHVSILDETMGTILSELRSMLDDEIGDQDELVFQVDKLGLEFSESSPSSALSTVTLRKILDLMDALAKNEDSEGYSHLFTYLFTRPDTLKRYKFLQDSAVGKKGLGDVLYVFSIPTDGSLPAADETEGLEAAIQEGFGGGNDFFEGSGGIDEGFFGVDDDAKTQEVFPGIDQVKMLQDAEEQNANKLSAGDLAVPGMADATLPAANPTVDHEEREQEPATGGLGVTVAAPGAEDLFETPEDEASGRSNIDQPPPLEDDLIEYTDDKIEATGEGSANDDGLALQDDAIITRLPGDDLIDYSDKDADGSRTTGLGAATAQDAGESLVMSGALSHDPNSGDTMDIPSTGDEHDATHLNAGGRHIRTTSDISISFSEAGPDQGVPALADGAHASPALQIFNLDEAVASGTDLLETESEAAALLESEVLNSDLANNQDDLSEIDWAAEADDDLGGDLDEAQPTAVKRSHPDDDGQGGSGSERKKALQDSDGRKETLTTNCHDITHDRCYNSQLPYRICIHTNPSLEDGYLDYGRQHRDFNEDGCEHTGFASPAGHKFGVTCHFPCT